MPERYEIRGKIARGGIGAIYRAHDTVMGREVAIKRLLPLEETHLNEAQDESLKREAAALARFQHPNVVTIYAFESDADGPYVVMEMVEGETLKEAVERAALPVEDFIELTMQVLDPLVAAKELNLLHRDIKPANIMLTWLASGRFQIKVLDFGLAKFSQAPSTQTLDQTGSFLGSIDYLAPEQLELQPLDQRTDLYSLGCVLYYTLAQRPPFEGDNAPKTMQNHLSHRVTHVAEIRPDVPGPIADWLMRLIERFPADRPTDAMQALTEFQAAIRGESPAEEVIPVAIAIPDDEPVLMAVRVPETQETPPAATDFVLEEPAQARTRTQPQLIVPKSGSAPVKGRTQPQLVVPSSKPASGPVTPKVGETVVTGSKGQASAPVKPKKAAAPQREERSWLREHPVMAVLGALALLGGLAFLLSRGGKPEKGKADPSEPPKASAQVSANSSTGSRNSSKPSAPPMPELKNPALPKRVAAVPATTAGLVAHYAASDGVLGTDLKKGAGSGDRVGLWGNLAPGAAADHLMAVEPQNWDRGPTLVTVQPSELPELAKPTPMLRFERSTRLIGYGKSAFAAKLKGAAMTTILVVRPDRERGPVLRLDSDEASPFLAWDMTPNGYSIRLAKGSLAPTIEAKLGSARGRLMVLTHVWDGESVEQRIHVTLPNGYHAMAAAGDAPFKAQAIQRYSLGAISSDPEANTFEGLLAEWLIYDRALNDEEREGVESQLVKKYLKPSLALTIDSATPQRNGVIPPARNTSIAAPKGLPKAPAEEFLAAFYLGAHGTLGHDLLQPARLGQRVMAWGNLAPGASADHLLAYQGGQDGHTPLLIRASAKEMPVIKDQWPLLRFAAGDTLEGKGITSIQSKLDDRELTAYCLVRCASDSGTLAEFETPTTTPALEIGYQAGKLSAAVLEGGGRKAATVSAAPTGEWSLIGMTWNGQEKKLRLWTVAPDGVRSAPGEVDSPVDTLAIDGYRIGKAGGAFTGDIGAVMIYRKALDETQQRAVEDYLRGQVFAK